MSTGNVTELPARVSDEDRAKQVREKLKPMLEQVAAVLNEAQKDGLTVNFTLNKDAYGRFGAIAVDVVRPL
jgi:hypothetical protein